MRNQFDQFRVDGLVDDATEGPVGHYLGDGELLADLGVVRDGLDDGPCVGDTRQERHGGVPAGHTQVIAVDLRELIGYASVVHQVSGPGISAVRHGKRPLAEFVFQASRVAEHSEVV